MEPKLRNDNSSQFFPVFLGITALILSVMFYGVMSVGMYVDGGQDKEVLGVNTVLHTATIKVKDGSVTKTYQGITFEGFFCL